MNIDFKNQVVVITGGAGSLGSAYVRAFSAKGAKVVINDPGTSLDGQGSGEKPAEVLAEQICAAGGEAISNQNSIAEPEGARELIAQAMDAFGRVDVVINNAGNMRDQMFKKLDFESFEAVLRVHLFGSTYVTRAAFPIMIEQDYGRILMTTSAAGLYGAFGGASYAAAKAGIVGLMRTLSIEGKKHNIGVNAIAPVAKSRMLGTMLSEKELERLTPESICPAVLYLCSDVCKATGDIISAGSGYFSKVAMVEGKGVRFPIEEKVTPENIAGCYDEITDMSAAYPYEDVWEVLSHVMARN